VSACGTIRTESGASRPQWAGPSGVGQVVNLRRVGYPPGAGPGKFLRRRCQPRRYRVPLDVMSNSLRLRIVANQSIVALVLPEWLASESEYSVALPGSESLERLHDLGNGLQRSYKEMNVVRHDDKRLEMIDPPIPILNGVHHHLGNIGHTQEERAVACAVEYTVHGQECLSGGDRRGKSASGGKAAMEAPCDEGSLAYRMKMRQAAAVKGGHERMWVFGGKVLTNVRRPITNRPQVDNLPHV